MKLLADFRTHCLALNAPPIPVEADGSVSSCAPTQGFNVVTLAPEANFESTWRLDFGGESMNGELPPGSPIPLPLTQAFNDSTLTVNNTSLDRQATFLAGLFGFNTSPNFPLRGTVTIGQYQSTGAQTSSGPMTLTLRNRTQEASLTTIIVGSSPPLNVALNTNPANLPPQWQGLEHFEAIQGQTFQISNNFFGQFIIVINVSLTNVPVDVNLV